MKDSTPVPPLHRAVAVISGKDWSLSAEMANLESHEIGVEALQRHCVAACHSIGCSRPIHGLGSQAARIFHCFAIGGAWRFCFPEMIVEIDCRRTEEEVALVEELGLHVAAGLHIGMAHPSWAPNFRCFLMEYHHLGHPLVLASWKPLNRYMTRWTSHRSHMYRLDRLGMPVCCYTRHMPLYPIGLEVWNSVRHSCTSCGYRDIASSGTRSIAVDSCPNSQLAVGTAL